MGLLAKVIKTAAKKADDFLPKKVVQKTVPRKMRSLSQTMKTTSAVASQGVTKATAGGSKAVAETAKAAAKGAGTTASVGGKVVAGTAIAAIPALTGVGLLNYYKNSTALTDEDRRLDYLMDKAKEAQDMGFDLSTGDPAVDNDPFARGTSGVSQGFNPFREAYGGSPQTESSQVNEAASLFSIAAVAAAIAGGVYVYKKHKRSKK